MSERPSPDCANCGAPLTGRRKRFCSESCRPRRQRLGRDPVWMTDQGVKERATLRVLHAHEQLTFATEGSCDGGYCMT